MKRIAAVGIVVLFGTLGAACGGSPKSVVDSYCVPADLRGDLHLVWSDGSVTRSDENCGAKQPVAVACRFNRFPLSPGQLVNSYWFVMSDGTWKDSGAGCSEPG